MFVVADDNRNDNVVDAVVSVFFFSQRKGRQSGTIHFSCFPSIVPRLVSQPALALGMGWLHIAWRFSVCVCVRFNIATTSSVGRTIKFLAAPIYQCLCL